MKDAKVVFCQPLTYHPFYLIKDENDLMLQLYLRD